MASKLKPKMTAINGLTVWTTLVTCMDSKKWIHAGIQISSHMIDGDSARS
jgi:hypothetical protein